MGLSGKIEREVEIKASPEQCHNIFRLQAHQIPNIANKAIHHVELHEGDNQTHGNIIKMWKYTIGGEVTNLKARTEFDDKNKKITFVGLEGDAMKNYKVLKLSYHIISKDDGQGSLIKMSVEYEKLNKDIPIPNLYLDMMTIVIKDIDEHLIKN